MIGPESFIFQRNGQALVPMCCIFCLLLSGMPEKVRGYRFENREPRTSPHPQVLVEPRYLSGQQFLPSLRMPSVLL